MHDEGPSVVIVYGALAAIAVGAVVAAAKVVACLAR